MVSLEALTALVSLEALTALVSPETLTALVSLDTNSTSVTKCTNVNSISRGTNNYCCYYTVSNFWFFSKQQLNQNFEGLKESHMLGLLSSRSDMDKKKAKEVGYTSLLGCPVGESFSFSFIQPTSPPSYKPPVRPRTNHQSSFVQTTSPPFYEPQVSSCCKNHI